MPKPYSTVVTLYVVLWLLGAVTLLTGGCGWHPCQHYHALELGFGFVVLAEALCRAIPKASNWGPHNRSKGSL